MKSNDISKFLSKDKKTINLPVPYGSTVYELETDCNNCCAIYPSSIRNQIPFKCDREAICHTKFRGVRPIEVTIDNLGYILKYWRHYIFDNPRAAEMEGKFLAHMHSSQFEDLITKLGMDSSKPYVIVIHKVGSNPIDLSKLADLLDDNEDK